VTDQFEIPGVPFPFVPSPAPSWRLDPEAGAVRATAAPHTDLFIDPGSGTTLNAESLLNAATLLGTAPPGDFQLSARVTVDFAATYDAGVLLLWVDERHWGKLCFEFSPAGEPMIVSVVTRGVSDDANAFVVPGKSVWLRVSRIDRAFAYHASEDGRIWRMIRFFTLDDAGDPPGRELVGLEAQSPTGDGCAVTFEEIRFVPERLAELRDGS
jgi:regulation of enolase protein 1 (concanavalin A-like superfamily)